MSDNVQIEGLRLACPWCGLEMLGNRTERCCVNHGWFEVEVNSDRSSITYRVLKLEPA